MCGKACAAENTCDVLLRDLNSQPGSDEARTSPTLPRLWSKRLGEASGSLASRTLRTGWRRERRGWIRSICDHRWRDTASACETKRAVRRHRSKRSPGTALRCVLEVTSWQPFPAAQLEPRRRMSLLRARWKTQSNQEEEPRWMRSESRGHQSHSQIEKNKRHIRDGAEQHEVGPAVPVGRSAPWQSRLEGRGRTSACWPGRSWAGRWLAWWSARSRPDLCLHQNSKQRQSYRLASLPFILLIHLFTFWYFDSATVCFTTRFKMHQGLW